MKIKDIQLAIKNAGIRGACYDLAYRVGKKAADLTVFQGMTLTPASLDRSFLEGNPKYQHGFLSEADLRRYAKTPGLELDDAFLDKALPQGDRCYAVRDGDTLASYGWYSRNPTPVNDDLVLHFDPKWVYMYKGFTAHAYRGQRLHAIGMAKAMMAYAEEGCLGIVSQVERNNFSSLKSVHRMGYVDNGRIRAWRVLGKWRVRATKACEPYGLRLTPR
jgi:hypothetical protein